MASLLGVTATRIRELARDGVMVKPQRGRYDVAASVAAYCERLRSVAARSGGRPPADSSPEAATAKERLTLAQAELAEVKLAAARGDLLPAAEVEATWTDAVASTRAALLAVPSRAAARAALDRETISILDDEIRLALKALADG